MLTNQAPVGATVRNLLLIQALLLAGCADVGPGSQRDEPVVTSSEALTTSYTVVFQDGSDDYAGTRDSYVSQNAPTTNYGTRTVLYVDGDDPSRTGRDLSTLLRFDLASIPADVLVTSAVLSLTVSDPSFSSYSLFALNRPWNEGECSWRRANASAAWQASGAAGPLDRTPTSLATVSAPETGRHDVVLNASGLVALQNWVTNPDSNHGWILTNTWATDKLAFFSSEYRVIASRPKLTVSYTVTTPDCIAPACCTTNAACDDGNACTSDSCSAGSCHSDPIAGCCNSVADCLPDGNACTTESCANHHCIEEPVVDCCTSDTDCADDDACTADTCVAATCAHGAIAGCCNDDAACNDANACTADSCIDHACNYGPIAGCCNDDAACNDANACTADSCSNHVCVTAPLPGCCLTDADCDDANVCTFDACVVNSCSHSPIPGPACGCQTALDCDDGQPCTIDTCVGTACVNTQASCDDYDSSSIDECVEGYCHHTSPVPTTVTYRNGENGYAGAADTKLAQYYPTTNYDTATVLVADGDEPSGGGNDVATIIRWDNIGIPSDATVTGASITLYIGGGTNSSSVSAYSIYALNREWTAGEATWERASIDMPWATAGALGELDRDASAIGATPVSVSGSQTMVLNSVGVDKVRGWIADPSSNHGVVIASSSNTDGLSLYSSEFTTVNSRPMLSVTYTTQQTTVDPEPVTAPTEGGQNYGFFVYSDSHVDAATNPAFSTALAQMNEIKN